MPEFKLENLLKISLPLLIILALLRLTAYYYSFDVPIVEYLEITETITLFLNDIASYLLLLLIPFFFTSKSSSPKYGLSYCAIICAAIAALNKGGDHFKVYLFLYFFLLIIVLYFQQSRFKLDKWRLAIIVYSSVLLIATIMGILQASGVKRAHYYSEVEITIDDKVIKTDSTLYYLGKTRNYIFLYDVANKGPVIYAGGKIDKVVFKSKEPENCLPVLP